ncbi:cationic amino acid transporter 6, chloroplastic-like [Nymphaea colorata]|nr:cationic amino acid transporter 6, chloroplastic-like [Nymphaea colorata]
MPTSSCCPINFSSIFHALSQTPRRLRERTCATWTPDEEVNITRLRSGADMKRKLSWYDLVALGVGGMLGAGVFVTTGRVAHTTAGPAVFISYLVAGISALLSSLCYTEFSLQIPAAGGAFSYLRITFGEFVGLVGGANMLMEYVLSNAAVARSLTEYASTAFGGRDADSWRVKMRALPKGCSNLDFPASVVVSLLTLCLCLGTKESSMLNLVMTIFHLLFFGLIIVGGFYSGSVRNLTRPKGLAPFGARGVFDGAALVYFSYLGYDSVSTMAEEIKNPPLTLPLGIAGSVAIVSFLYCLMSLALSLMVPYNELTGSAPFAYAFERVGAWRWGREVVGAGASLGILTSLLVAMLGQSRYLCVVGRARLVPSWFAKVHPSTGTPLNATAFLGTCTALISLFIELDIVLEMISIGALLVYYLVPNALIYHRYARPGLTLAFLLLVSGSSFGFALSWKLKKHWLQLALFGGLTILCVACFQYWVPMADGQRHWRVPFMPWPAATSIFLNVFLLATMKKRAYQRFVVWSCLVTLYYVLYGVHSTYHGEREEREGRGQDSVTDQVKVEIEMP